MKTQLHFGFIAAVFCFSLTDVSGQTSALPSVEMKYGKGLKITAADSSMQLKIGVRAQSLFEAGRGLGEDGESYSALSVRRARLKFDGWALNPDLNFKFEMGLAGPDIKANNDAPETGDAPKIMLDAQVIWQFHKNFKLVAGQGKLPGNRERIVSSQRLQFVDRSLVNNHFNLDRDMGVQLHGEFPVSGMVVRPILAISSGEGRNMVGDNIGGFAYTARLEWLPMGEFTNGGDYFESDLSREKTPKIMVSAAYDLNDGASRQKQTGRFLKDDEGNYLSHDLTTAFVDLIFKYNGFSFSSEFAHKKFQDLPRLADDGFPPADALDVDGKSYYTGKGIVAQAGYLFKNNWELAARYTHVRPDHEMSFKPQDQYTLGVSRYIVGHTLKVQSDVSLLETTSTGDKELQYRLQVEFGF